MDAVHLQNFKSRVKLGRADVVAVMVFPIVVKPWMVVWHA